MDVWMELGGTARGRLHVVAEVVPGRAGAASLGRTEVPLCSSGICLWQPGPCWDDGKHGFVVFSSGSGEHLDALRRAWRKKHLH